MFFSVVIPLYNKRHFVRETLESILAQTHADFEVVVVDDCSTDGSLEIVEQFSDQRIRIVKHKRNKGLSASRNTGIRNAKHDVIAFLDADDIWMREFLAKMSALIETFPEAGLYATNYVEQFGQRRVAPKQNIKLRDREAGIINDYFDAALAQPILWYGSAAVRKSTFENVGYFDEAVTLCEDVEFNIRANLNVKFAFLNEALAAYRVFSQNQIMNAPLAGKTIPDFDRYEPRNGEHPSLKRYLDMNRYLFAMWYKRSGDAVKSKEMRSRIDSGNLTLKQRFLLNSPVFVSSVLRKVKVFLVKNGFRVTSFE